MSREPCIVCGATVYYGNRKLREGPEGGIRCTEHLDHPAPANIQDLSLKPVEGEDYYLAEHREYVVHYAATARATWTGWACDEPESWDLERTTEPEIEYEECRDLVSVSQFQAIPESNPPARFDEDAWRQERLEDLGVLPARPSRLPRPELPLDEVVS